MIHCLLSLFLSVLLYSFLNSSFFSLSKVFHSGKVFSCSIFSFSADSSVRFFFTSSIDFGSSGAFFISSGFLTSTFFDSSTFLTSIDFFSTGFSSLEDFSEDHPLPRNHFLFSVI